MVNTTGTVYEYRFCSTDQKFVVSWRNILFQKQKMAYIGDLISVHELLNDSQSIVYRSDSFYMYNLFESKKTMEKRHWSNKAYGSGCLQE